MISRLQKLADLLSAVDELAIEGERQDVAGSIVGWLTRRRVAYAAEVQTEEQVVRAPLRLTNASLRRWRHSVAGRAAVIVDDDDNNNAAELAGGKTAASGEHGIVVDWDGIDIAGLEQALEADVTSRYGRGPQQGFWNRLRSCGRILMHCLRWLPVAIGWLIVRYVAPSLRPQWNRWVLATLKHSGPCFVKLGQWISTRPDIFPRDLCLVLTQLHSGAPAHAWSDTLAAFQRALPQRGSGAHAIHALFADFDVQPIASGAIAQVYRARLHSGEQVAVKVRHPDVASTIALDLSILHTAAALANRLSAFRPLSLPVAVAEFSRIMLNQADLRAEVVHLLHFRKNFTTWQGLIDFPRPLAIATDELLIESFCDGVSIQNYLGSDHHGSEPFRKQVAYLGMVAFLKMLIDDNFVHADLHPGNILVVAKPAAAAATTSSSRLRLADEDSVVEPCLSILDVGLVASLSTNDRDNFLALLQSVLNGEGRRGAQLMIERSPSASSLSPEQVQGFVDEINDLLSSTIANPLKEIPIAESLFQMFQIAHKYHVVLEANFVTLMTGIMTIEGVARQLDADFNLRDEARAWFLRSSNTSLWERAKIIRKLMTKLGKDTAQSIDRRQEQ